MYKISSRKQMNAIRVKLNGFRTKPRTFSTVQSTSLKKSWLLFSAFRVKNSSNKSPREAIPRIPTTCQV